MTYDEASRRWAARRLGVPEDEIARVDFDLGTDFHDTEGHGSPVVDVNVIMVGGDRRYVDLGFTSLPEILRELIEQP